MANRRAFDTASARRGWPATIVTLATIGLIEVLSRTLLAIPDATALYVVIVAYAAFQGGLWVGGLNAALALVHAVYFLGAPGELFVLSDETAGRIKALAIALVIVVLLVAHLKRDADEVGAVVEANALLKGQLAERARAEQAARALALMGRKLLETLDFGQVADRIVFTLFHLFRVTRAVLYELHRDTGALVCIATAGETDAGRWLGQTLPPGSGVAGRAVAERQAMWAVDLVTSDLALPPWAVERYLDEGYRSTSALPLIARGEVLGALVVVSPPGRDYSEEERRLLAIFADQAALALENSRLYQELREALEHLHTSHQQVVRRERLAAVDELTRNLAHHLNNRLAVILWRAEALARNQRDSDLALTLDMIAQTTRETADLIRRLVEASSVPDAHRATAIDLNDLIRDATQTVGLRWQDEARRRGVTIEQALDPDRLLTVVHPAPLSEALVALIVNALEALPEGGQVRIATGRSIDDVQVTVADDGPGMSNDVRDRVLEPFFTTKGPQRAGLGLSNAYRIARQCGGDLTIETAPGRGTAVTLRLPSVAPAESREIVVS